MSWSGAEDAKLVAAVKRSLPDDINWTTVAGYSGLPAKRTGKACRLRYFNHLQPGLLLSTPFSVDEDLTVVRRQAVMGNSWSSISALLHGRTDNAVKNR